MTDKAKHISECLIPAAGTSSRMGSWKLLLDYQGKPLIYHSITTALSWCDRVILVTGFRGDELYAEVEKYISADALQRIRRVENPDYQRGMFSSIQCGLESSTSSRIFILLADLPTIPKELFPRLLMQLQTSEADVVRPVYNQIPGHPVLINARMRNIILQMNSKASMQEAFENGVVKQVSVEEIGSITDVDTPEAYRDLIRRS
jgi:molybdenum cofactor cytidylyltransferase